MWGQFPTKVLLMRKSNYTAGFGVAPFYPAGLLFDGVATRDKGPFLPVKLEPVTFEFGGVEMLDVVGGRDLLAAATPEIERICLSVKANVAAKEVLVPGLPFKHAIAAADVFQDGVAVGLDGDDAEPVRGRSGAAKLGRIAAANKRQRRDRVRAHVTYGVELRPVELGHVPDRGIFVVHPDGGVFAPLFGRLECDDARAFIKLFSGRRRRVGSSTTARDNERKKQKELQSEHDETS
jgi:hypothetical protein